MLGSTSVILVSSQSINFSIADNKTLSKFSYLVPKSCTDCSRGGHDSTIAPNQGSPNTDNFTSMNKHFVTLKKRKLPSPIPITLPDIYIKM